MDLAGNGETLAQAAPCDLAVDRHRNVAGGPTLVCRRARCRGRGAQAGDDLAHRVACYSNRLDAPGQIAVQRGSNFVLDARHAACLQLAADRLHVGAVSRVQHGADDFVVAGAAAELPASQSAASSSVGSGLLSSSALAETMKPGVQMPHCSAACSRNFCCNGCRRSLRRSFDGRDLGRRPSTARTRQELTSTPLRMTLHAPQLPLLHPSLAPVNCSVSRRTSSKLCKQLAQETPVFPVDAGLGAYAFRHSLASLVGFLRFRPRLLGNGRWPHAACGGSAPQEGVCGTRRSRACP